jgi:transcription-repair coupling factor (superfamily II helicase)
VANDCGVISVIQKNNNIIITFRNDANVDPMKLTQLAKKMGKITFTVANNPYITYSAQEEVLNMDIKLLTELVYGIKLDTSDGVL